MYLAVINHIALKCRELVAGCAALYVNLWERLGHVVFDVVIVLAACCSFYVSYIIEKRHI